MQTIGERLEEARKRKGISIREAAESTKIRGDYLQKFESNQFDLDLATIYVRGFLRTYANFLKLPAEKIVNDFNGLGLGANGRARSPSREVYGRMDISVASADEAQAAEPAPTPGEPAPSNPRRSLPPFSRGGGGGMPALPMINPALVLKIGMAVGGLIVLLLIIWGIKALVSGGETPDGATASGGSTIQQTTPAERTITLVALDSVRVTVQHRKPDDSVGDVIFTGTLGRGQTQVVSWPGPIYITASAGENLEIDYLGKRYPTGFKGYGKAKM